MTHVAIAGLQFDALPRVSFTTIGHGLIILIIAEVFRTGTTRSDSTYSPWTPCTQPARASRGRTSPRWFAKQPTRDARM